MEKKPYFIGLDIGTTSIGYAVTDSELNLLKFKKKNMWGVRLFEEGQKAEQTRLFRSQRRRYLRRRNRIGLLQEFFAKEICKVDKGFFMRLKESFFQWEDRSLSNFHTLFSDAQYCDKDYYKEYKNIYYLRKALVDNKEKADIRLVYLTLHHMIKYRGNFLYDGQEFSDNAGNIESSVKVLLQTADEFYRTDLFANEKNGKQIVTILEDIKLRKKEKQEQLGEFFGSVLPKQKEIIDAYKELVKAILGYKANQGKLFMNEETTNVAFSDDNVDEIDRSFLDDQGNSLYEAMFSLYSAITLGTILQGEVNISSGMIKKYNKHKKDLQILKKLIKEQFSEKYQLVFAENQDVAKKNISRGQAKADKNSVNYAAYSGRYAKASDSKDQFYDFLKKQVFVSKEELLTGKNSDYAYVKNEMDNGSFLELLNTKENGAIPYQLHEKELLAIIDNQGQYYPFLKEEKSKIQWLLKFRLPYYVGPLNYNPNSNRQFAWMKRRQQGKKIYPWNFEEVVDVDQTAEIFIRKMTNKCTYLPNKDVIPKNSLLYAEYEVLMELNKIRVDGHFIEDHHFKAEMLEDLFANPKGSSVDGKKFLQWLKLHKSGLIFGKDINKVRVTGYQKEGAFASYQKSKADFKKIFGKIDEENEDMIEELILWITLFEDKKILERKIKGKYTQLTEDQIKAIKKLKYKGWSRLSREFLTGIYYVDEHQEKLTTMGLLRKTNLNLMQIINDKKMGFNKIIAEANQVVNDETIDEIVSNLPASPGVKKGVSQALKVLEELVLVQKSVPEKIFIEFARGDEKSERTQSRKQKLEKIYKECLDDNDFKTIYEELKKQKDISKKALYLYFMQNGKCLYTKEKLYIDQLSHYEIDHIIPQSYIKDDSFDNLALVKSIENQRKSDSLLLNTDVINKQSSWWNILRSRGLISEKKYYNLTRLSFSENEIQGFVHRQLVETRQIIKCVVQILEQKFPNIGVYAVKAGLPAGLRAQYGLPKVREINDYHHAFDAYLSIVISAFLARCYPNWEENMKYKEYIKYVTRQQIFKKQKNGYFISQLSENHLDKETGEILWKGEEQLAKLRKAYNYKDCFMSRKVEELSGDFYNQNISAKGEYFPIRKGLNPQKYGGYDGIQSAYYIVIEYIKNGKKKDSVVKKLVGVPIYIHSLRQEKPEVIYEYLDDFGYGNCKIVKDHIKKYQRINFEGQDYYIVGPEEAQNACQLVVSEGEQKLIAQMLSGQLKEEDHKQIEAIYTSIINKMMIYYPGYRSLAEKIEEQQSNFMLLKPTSRCAFIREMLKITKANAENGAFAKFKKELEENVRELKNKGERLNIRQEFTLKDRAGRKTNFALPAEKLVFIDTSITGLHERRTMI